MIDRRYLPLALVTTMAMLSAGGATGPRVPPRVPVVTITAREFAFDAPDSNLGRSDDSPACFPVGDKNTSSSS